MPNLQTLIESGDTDTLTSWLSQHPEQANAPINWGPHGKNRAHPLQYVCDCVFEGRIAEDTAKDCAELLLSCGADINGFHEPTRDTPLITACSLHTDDIAGLYLVYQPDLTHRGVHGGTALHWAAWTGSGAMTKKLIEAGAPLRDADNEFGGSPLFWALDGACDGGGERNQRQQLSCLRLLLDAGLKANAPNRIGQKPLDLVNANKHPEVATLLHQYL